MRNVEPVRPALESLEPRLMLSLRQKGTCYFSLEGCLAET